MLEKIIKEVEENGNIQAFKIICEYVIGKPKETISLTQESAADLLPFISSKEGRERAAEIFKQAMKEVEELNESHD